MLQFYGGGPGRGFFGAQHLVIRSSHDLPIIGPLSKDREDSLGKAPVATVSPSPVYRYSTLTWIFLLSLPLPLVFIFYDGLAPLVDSWFQSEEYSHGVLIPFVAAFMIWQRKNQLQSLSMRGAWSGIAVIAAGIAAYIVGELSTLFVLIQYAFLVVLVGLALSLLGWRGMRIIWAPLVILALVVPLPAFIYNSLSNQLQLLSSAIGVEIIRLFGVSVFLSGNVIDLGTYKLQVAEACNGLRYLFPLLTLAVIVACFYRAALWKRAAIVLSALPITIFMNSFRIGLIGVAVQYWGQSVADGFLHYFEGWVVFMACFGLLFLEMLLLNRIRSEGDRLSAVFYIDIPAATPRDSGVQREPVPRPFLVGYAMLALAMVPALLLPSRAETIPEREEFLAFPMTIQGWQGRRDTLEQIYIDELKFEDYLLANYWREGANDHPVNLYIAYYSTQRKGESAHSPRSCIPGGGWEMSKLGLETIPGIAVGARPLRINRVETAYGNDRQLVYYWFQQRGRIISNEYLVKWFLFWDALTRNRTDGALVRLTTSLKPGEEWAAGDGRLASLAKAVVPRLERYVPN